MKVAFPRNPVVELLGHDRGRMVYPFTMEVDTNELREARVPGALGHVLIVPEGFEHDFASVIRTPIAYWLFGNTAHRAAIVHDYLYSVRCPRALADQVFFAAMRAESVRDWRRYPMYAAVRLFGRFFYPKESAA